MSTQILTGEAIRTTVIEAMEAGLLREETKRGPLQPKDHLWASGWHPCRRNLYLQLTDPAPGFDPTTDGLQRMKRGREREHDLLRQLEDAGHESGLFEIVARSERIEIADRDGVVLITGKVDAFLIPTGGKGLRIPMELKSWPRLGESVEVFEDLDRSPFTRGAGYQLLSYLYGQKNPPPFGLLVLDRAGLPKLIEVPLLPNLERVESFLSDAREAIDARAAGEAPTWYADKAECCRCRFYKKNCFPEIKAEAGVVVFTDEEIITDTARAVALKPSAQEYERLWKRLKETYKGVAQGIAGENFVRGEAKRRVMKAQPAKEAEPERVTEYWQTEIVPMREKAGAPEGLA